MANQMTITFNVENQILSRTDTNRIVEKAKNYVNANFEFNELWDDTTKAILIEGSGLRYKVYLNENNECSIPNRVVRYDGFTLTVVGEDTDKNITITTNDLFISILKNNATTDIPSYVEVIESDTLDVTREGEKYNLEIPESYKNCYIVTRNDVSDITLLSNNTYSITLSEEMEQIITGFKQNLYVDWVTEFPELSSILGIVKLTNCYPSKKINGDEEVPTYYIFSATDSLNDFSMGFFYEDDTWKVTITYGALADREYVSMEVSRLENQIGEKSTVIPNPTLSGDEPDLEGAEIDGIKYKVGGGAEVHLYQHNILITFTSGGLLRVSIIKSDNTPFTYETFNSYLVGTGFYPAEGWLTSLKRNIQEFRVLTDNYLEYRYIEVVDGVLNEDYASTRQYTLGTDVITQIF